MAQGVDYRRLFEKLRARIGELPCNRCGAAPLHFVVIDPVVEEVVWEPVPCPICGSIPCLHVYEITAPPLGWRRSSTTLVAPTA